MVSVVKALGDLGGFGVLGARSWISFRKSGVPRKYPLSKEYTL